MYMNELNKHLGKYNIKATGHGSLYKVLVLESFPAFIKFLYLL